MSKQVLSIEQMQHLKELGVDTSKASAKEYIISETESYCGYSRSIVVIDGYIENYIEENIIFTLQDILDLLPVEIEKENRNYQLEIYRNPQRYYVSYYWLDNLLISLNEVEFIDAAYEMLCWVIDNGYLKFE